MSLSPTLEAPSTGARPITVSRLLVWGMVAGLVAALAAFLVAKLVGEGPVQSAIDFEGAAAHAAGEHEEADLVSRTIQSTVGLGTAVLVYGTAIGGLFSLAYAFALGRLGSLSARATAVTVAVLGFGTVYLVPFLKYPANPPAVGNPDTIGRRTGLFMLMIVIAVAAAIGAIIIAKALAPKLGGWNAIVTAIAGYAVVVFVAAWLMPTINEVPAAFPATTLWSFRAASLQIQVVLWTVLVLVFTALLTRGTRAVAAPPVE